MLGTGGKGGGIASVVADDVTEASSQEETIIKSEEVEEVEVKFS